MKHKELWCFFKDEYEWKDFVCTVFHAWMPQSHMVYMSHSLLLHATPNYQYNDMTLLPHLHVTHLHQMWSIVCIQQPVEIQTITFLKMPGRDLKGNIHASKCLLAV